MCVRVCVYLCVAVCRRGTPGSQAGGSLAAREEIAPHDAGATLSLSLSLSGHVLRISRSLFFLGRDEKFSDGSLLDFQFAAKLLMENISR